MEVYFCQNPNLTTTQPQPNLNLVGFDMIITLHTPHHHHYHNMKGREEDDECKSKTIKNQTHSQSSHMVDPAVPDRHGQTAVTRPTQYATHHERGRLSECTGDGEWIVME